MSVGEATRESPGNFVISRMAHCLSLPNGALDVKLKSGRRSCGDPPMC